MAEPVKNPFQFVIKPVEEVVAEVSAGLKYLGSVAQRTIAWVDKNVPGAASVVGQLIQEGDQALVSLEQYAASYGSDLINAGIADGETWLLNHINATGLDLTTKKTLAAGDVATLADAKAIGQLIISAALSKVIATTNQIATAVGTPGTGGTGGVGSGSASPLGPSGGGGNKP